MLDIAIKIISVCLLFYTSALLLVPASTQAVVLNLSKATALYTVSHVVVTPPKATTL